MIFTQDMKELIEFLEKHNVKYVMVGGFAVNFYGYVRMTQDIDILIFPSPENALRMMNALDEFGFGSAGIPTEYFEIEGTAIHLGVEPNRIDLLTNLKGISNKEIFEKKERVKFKNMFINIISLQDLLTCKKSSDRLKDLADAEELGKKKKDNRK